MTRRVFYSWQSDLPNATIRGFILAALEAACKAAGEDLSVDERPEVDRDTLGVPGAPDIAQTIFAKIDRADILFPMFRSLSSQMETTGRAPTLTSLLSSATPSSRSTGIASSL